MSSVFWDSTITRLLRDSRDDGTLSIQLCAYAVAWVLRNPEVLLLVILRYQDHLSSGLKALLTGFLHRHPWCGDRKSIATGSILRPGSIYGIHGKPIALISVSRPVDWNDIIFTSEPIDLIAWNNYNIVKIILSNIGGAIMNIRPSAAIRQNYNEIADLCRKTAEPILTFTVSAGKSIL